MKYICVVSTDVTKSFLIGCEKANCSLLDYLKTRAVGSYACVRIKVIRNQMKVGIYRNILMV